MASDDWADSCDNATVVSSTGQYGGTLDTSDDEDHFKTQLTSGEYITIEATVPTEASEPEIYHRGDFTLRSVSNTRYSGTDEVGLDPGFTGTYELWAESDTTLCFDIHENDTNAGYPYDWDISLTKTNPDIADQWGDSNSSASVVDPTGNYGGTLITPDDEDHFKTQLTRGEYITVEATVPTEASESEIYHRGDFTLRSVSNTRYSGTDEVGLDPGFTGTYELWAESDTTLEFDVHENDIYADYPYDWDISLTKTNPGIADQWGDSNSSASVVDPTGNYGGTLITPDDEDHFKTQLNQGESITVEATVPTEASEPEIYHSGDFTLRNVSNTRYSGTDEVGLDPGFTGTYEIEANSNTTISFDVHENDIYADYPYDWHITLGNPPEPTQVGLRFEISE